MSQTTSNSSRTESQSWRHLGEGMWVRGTAWGMDSNPSSEISEGRTTLGKRGRDLCSDSLSVSKEVKHMKLSHEQYHVYGTPYFVPKYIADRIPIPMELLSSLFNTYLDDFDKEIIGGQLKYIDSAHELTRWIQHWDHRVCMKRDEGSHQWYIARDTIFSTNANNPTPN